MSRPDRNYTITDFHEKIGLDPDSRFTGMPRPSAASGFVRSWTSEYVVRQSLNDLRRSKIVSVPGWNYRMIVMLLRRLPLGLLHWMAGGGNKSHRYE